jgi:hypothetical protein
VFIRLVLASAAVALAILLLWPMRAELRLHFRARGGGWARLSLGLGPPGLAVSRRLPIPGDWPSGALRRLIRAPAPVTAPGTRAGPWPPPALLARLAVGLRGLRTVVRPELVLLRLRLGTGDAATTALLCGLAGSAGGWLSAWLAARRSSARVRLRFLPAWSSELTFQADLRCIARLRLCQAILAAWRVYRACVPGRACRDARGGPRERRWHRG